MISELGLFHKYYPILIERKKGVRNSPLPTPKMKYLTLAEIHCTQSINNEKMPW